MSRRREKKRVSWAWIVVLLLIVVALIVADSSLRIVTNEYEAFFDDLPPEFDGYRIVQISDLHARRFGEGNRRLMEAVLTADPDIIAVTGDLIDSDNQGETAREILGALAPIAPVYYVTGNHEWDSGGLDELWRIIEESGVTSLRNEYVLLNEGDASIVLAGAEDPGGPSDMETPEELVSAIRRLEGGDSFIVMLNHRNDRLERYAALGVQLVLSGHAHGGLIRLPFTDGLIGPGRDLLPDYTSGIYTSGDTVMVVSRGFGGPVRFLNNPEITVTVLRAG
ncbi:MAG: metallophosphoesterase [Oscillospiraceae bacterium]|nr:metallophosphoesterase [Oscillospiraceae bacterium]